MNRRKFLGLLAVGYASQTFSGAAWGAESFDFANARSRYLDRLNLFRKEGVLPIIDIESSYNPLDINLQSFVRSMDRAGIAMMCLSVDQPGRLVSQGAIWSDHSLEVYEKYPAHFIPTGNGGNHPAWTQFPDRFLEAQERFILEHRYPMMGEFEIRHYPSPRQIQRGETFRDVDVPIANALVERVFAFSEKTGIPFQVHYEVEDRLLDPLAEMLTKYPKAKVIWCHLAQVRYQERTIRYSPQLLHEWLLKFPNLYIDTAFGDSRSTYPPSGERHARYWSNIRGWSEVIAAHPWRFLAALDIGGDRMHRVEEWTRTLRQFLDTLAPQVREIVAYRAAWKLLFGEEI